MSVFAAAIKHHSSETDAEPVAKRSKLGHDAQNLAVPPIECGDNDAAVAAKTAALDDPATPVAPWSVFASPIVRPCVSDQSHTTSEEETSSDFSACSPAASDLRRHDDDCATASADLSPARAEDDDEQEAPAPAARAPQSLPTPRTLVLERWTRTFRTERRLDRHYKALGDKELGTREERVLATTLNGRRYALEPNLFPYDCPRGIEHWTLWCRDDDDEPRNDSEMEALVGPWLAREMPCATEWNWQANEQSSILLPHLHIFIRKGEVESTGSLGISLGDARVWMDDALLDHW